MATEVFDFGLRKSGSAVLHDSVSFYARGVQEVLQRPRRAVFFALLSLLQAAGHAGLALGGAACAQAMLGVKPRVPGALVWLTQGDLVLRLAGFGLIAAIVKCMGSVGSSYLQTQLVGEMGEGLRLRVLALRAHSVAHPRHGDQGAQRGRTPTPAHIAGPAEPAEADREAGQIARGVDALTTGVREVQAGTGAWLGGAKAVLQLLPLAALAAWSGGRLLAVAALVLLPFAWLLSRARKRVAHAQRRSLDHGASLLEVADESVRHAELWASYGAEARVRGRLARAGRSLTHQASRAAATTAGLSGATEALGALALFLAVWGAHAGALGGGAAASGARLLPFAVAFFMAYRPIRDLAEARLAWARARVALDRLGLEREPAALDAPSVAAPGASADLELRGLRLVRGALGRIDAHVSAGTIVVVSGATGIGKTTLLRTLLGLEAPAAGTIRYGDESLESLPAGPARRPFAWVPQDAPVVRGTLSENVGLGGPADVMAVMRAIGAEALAERLGEAQLGAGGRALSGGEQKQVAIARAFATSQPVLLLDEPTTGLDERAQALVLSAIERLRGQRTVLLVTHRPEPIAIADQVLALGSPSIVSGGPVLTATSRAATTSPSST